MTGIYPMNHSKDIAPDLCGQIVQLLDIGHTNIRYRAKSKSIPRLAQGELLVVINDDSFAKTNVS